MRRVEGTIKLPTGVRSHVCTRGVTGGQQLRKSSVTNRFQVAVLRSLGFLACPETVRCRTMQLCSSL